MSNEKITQGEGYSIIDPEINGHAVEIEFESPTEPGGILNIHTEAYDNTYYFRASELDLMHADEMDPKGIAIKKLAKYMEENYPGMQRAYHNLVVE